MGHPHKGVSELIVPMDLPGIEVRPITDMTTNRHFCEVYFDDVRARREPLSVSRGNAFKQTMAQLEHERGGIDRSSPTSRFCTTARRGSRTRATPGSVRRSPASRPGTGSAGSSTARR